MLKENEAFRTSCANAHLVITQWLYSLGNVNIHDSNEYAYMVLDVNIPAESDEAFRTSRYAFQFLMTIETSLRVVICNII
jgi:hypothetical protein